jgi:hypothetical protein
MTLALFLSKLNAGNVEFEDTMAVIDAEYVFTETAFTNGDCKNEAGQNSGSCKLFSLAQLQNLSEAQTLACFGRYYHDEVMNDPDGDSHQNIRNFIKTGWSGISFSGVALSAK